MRYLISCKLILVFLFAFHNIYAQPAGTSQQEFIDKYKQIAISQMQEYGVPASITIAQAILESAWGTSDLAIKANNFFGIKCKKDWNGSKFYKDDDLKNECFRKYKRVSDSFIDHSVFIVSGSNYKDLFNLKITDYQGWAKGLQDAGYATNPNYANLLIQIIEKYELHKYDSNQKIKTTKSKEKSEKEKVQKSVVAQKPNREILINNRVKYVVAKEGDSVESLANELMKGAWELYRYNNLTKKDTLSSGQIIYLQSKRKKSRAFTTHIVQENETIRDISNKYAIKEKQIYKLNPEINKTEPISAGQIIKLR